ncbi:MAG: hypothetical protein AAFR38_00900 [Planctomycetota bacterium]
MDLETTATWVLLLLGIYVALGLLAGLAFVLMGAARVDPATRGTGWAFKLLILPGCVALWPLMVGRWVMTPPAPSPPADRDGTSP